MRQLKIKHISDWHGGYNSDVLQAHLNDGFEPDLLVVTGDMVADVKVPPDPMTYVKQEAGLKELTALLRAKLGDKLPILAVPGNHDWISYQSEDMESFDVQQPRSFVLPKLGVKVTGFRGVPWFTGLWSTELSPWHYPYILEGLDPEADLLITHTPPLGILDRVWRGEDVGMPGLMEWVLKSKVRAHMFGHIHEARGTVMYEGRLFSNAATSCNNLTVDLAD
jgi:Icc-related predicted phosphoesterase